MPPSCVIETSVRRTPRRSAWVRAGQIDYLACWPGEALLDHVISDLLDRAEVATTPMPDGVRINRRGGLVIAVNSAAQQRSAPAPDGAAFVLGAHTMPPAGVSIWRDRSQSSA